MNKRASTLMVLVRRCSSLLLVVVSLHTLFSSPYQQQRPKNNAIRYETNKEKMTDAGIEPAIS